MTSVLGDERVFTAELGEDELPRRSAPVGEAKILRRYDQDQCLLLPPRLDEWLLEDHEARVVSEVLEHLLDLAPIYAGYTSAAGAPTYHPKMRPKLVVYAYATGVTSSRELERGWSGRELAR
jgi:transposase